jgi:hypothetical protein
VDEPRRQDHRAGAGAGRRGHVAQLRVCGRGGPRRCVRRARARRAARA